MYASLGTITFATIASPSKFDTTTKYKYAKLEVIGAAPVLQYVYTDLKEVALTITFHQMWCNPQASVEAVENLAATHKAQAFVLGNGVHLGSYVVSLFKVKNVWQADNGNLIAVECDIELTEYVASAVPAGTPPANTTVGNPPAVVTVANQTPPVVNATDLTVAKALTAFTQAQATTDALAYLRQQQYFYAITMSQLALYAASNPTEALSVIAQALGVAAVESVGINLLSAPIVANPSVIAAAATPQDVLLQVVSRWGL